MGDGSDFARLGVVDVDDGQAEGASRAKHRQRNPKLDEVAGFGFCHVSLKPVFWLAVTRETPVRVHGVGRGHSRLLQRDLEAPIPASARDVRKADVIGVVQPQGVRVSPDSSVVLDLQKKVELPTALAEDEVEGSVRRCVRVAAGSEALGLVHERFPVSASAVDPDRTAQRVRVESFVPVQRDRQVVEQVLPPIEQGRYALGREELSLRLALNEKALHLHQLPEAEPGHDEECKTEKHEFRTEAGPPAEKLHYLLTQRYPYPYSLLMHPKSASARSNFLRMFRMCVLIVLFVTSDCIVAFISVS